VAVKSVRIIRLVLLLALAGYLWLFHAANRQQVELPILNYLLPPIPVAYVTRLSLWRRSREVKKLRERVAELEAVSAGPPVSRTSVTSPRRATHSPYSEHETELPVIPDRGDPYPGETTSDDEAG